MGERERGKERERESEIGKKRVRQREATSGYGLSWNLRGLKRSLVGVMRSSSRLVLLFWNQALITKSDTTVGNL